MVWGDAAYILPCIARNRGKRFSLLFLLIPAVNTSAYVLLAFGKEVATSINAVKLLNREALDRVGMLLS